MAYRVSRDDQHELAGAVWIAAVVYCAALSAASMAITIAAAAISESDSFDVAWLVFGVMLVGLAGAFGSVVGAILGIPLGLLVTVGHRRLGVRAVSTLILVVTVILSEAVVYGLFRVRSGPALGLVAFFAFIGAVLIDRRYQRAAREHPVH